MTAKGIKLDRGGAVVLPPEVITRTLGILAMRGAGKSNTAAVLTEGLYAAGLPFVVFDPVGVWWGLRANRAGNAGGLAVPIFGGDYADVPLERGAGHELAETVVAERMSCVLDLSEFSEGDKTRFLADFAERLFKRNREPLHLILEEADDYVPQRPMRDQARTLGAFQRIVKRGRSRGLGATLITQRSAALSKDVLTQIDTLIVLRTPAMQDRKAIQGWIEYHGQARDLLESLPGLADGEAWIWSPHWLGEMRRCKIRRRRTFDSGATPTAAGRAAARLTDIDLPALRERLQAAVQQAAENDPKALRGELAKARARIAELERTTPETVTERVEVSVLTKTDRSLLESLEVRLQTIGVLRESMETAASGWEDAIALLREIAARNGGVAQQARSSAPRSQAPTSPRPAHTSAEASPLGVGEFKILVAIAQHREGVTREQLGVLTGYRRSTRNTYLQRLRAAGLIDDGSVITVTPAGIAALGSDYTPLPTGGRLRDHWLDVLSGGEREILRLVCEAWPDGVDREAIGETTGYARSSRNTYIQRLVARRLVQVRDGIVYAAELLFDA